MGEDGESGNIGQLRAQVAVGQGEEPQDGQGKPDAPAGSFQDEKDGEVTQDEVPGVGITGPVDELIEVQDDVARKSKGQNRQGNFKVGNLLGVQLEFFLPGDSPESVPEHEKKRNPQGGQNTEGPDDEARAGFAQIVLSNCGER